MSGALAFAALALAVGAEDDEVGAMWARLGPTEIPRHPQDAIAQMRATLREVRGGHEEEGTQ